MRLPYYIIKIAFINVGQICTVSVFTLMYDVAESFNECGSFVLIYVVDELTTLELTYVEEVVLELTYI